MGEESRLAKYGADGAEGTTSFDGAPIESLIYTVRGTQVMLDSDLAMLY